MGSQAMQSALWGRDATNWASIQEGTGKSGYDYALSQLKIKPADNLLDIGCGSGYFCQMASRATNSTKPGAGPNTLVPDTPAIRPNITGFDATAPLLEQARLRAPEIKFVQGDMESLPFEDASFDIVTGFNSFQYAANVPAALREAKRVLKMEGRLVAMVWGNKADCEAATYLAAIGSLLPPPPPGAPGPFALTENNRLEQVLKEAGFTITTSMDVPSVWDYPDMDTALKGLLSAGPATRAIDHSGWEKTYETIKAAAQPYLQSNGRVIYKNTYRVVLAQN